MQQARQTPWYPKWTSAVSRRFEEGKPTKPKKKEKRKEKGSGEKKRNHTHIATKMSCTLLTTHPSLLPKYRPSYTNTMTMLALNTQRMTIVPQTLHPIPIKAISPCLVRLCKVCPSLKNSTNRGSNCFHLAHYSPTVEGKFFPVALSP